jgi:RNA polymerase sigma factor (sigma-70 family)
VSATQSAARPRKGVRRREFRRLDDYTRQLAESNWPYARHFAAAFARRTRRDLPADELVAEAGVALCYAAGKFDPAAGVPFPAYLTLVLKHWLIQVARARRRRAAFPVVSLAAFAGEDGRRDPTVGREPDPGEAVAANNAAERVRPHLTARSFRVLLAYYGHGRTLQEIGDVEGVTRERVRQICAKGRNHARTALRGGLEI